MIRFFIFLFFSLFLTHISSQYIFGTNVAQPNAIITIQSVDSLKGIKIPVVKSSDLLSPTSDMASMIIYDIQDSCFKLCNGVYWDCLSLDTNELWTKAKTTDKIFAKSALALGDTVVVTNAGRIGIGMSSPSTSLDIIGSSIYPMKVSSSSASGNMLLINNISSSSNKIGVRFSDYNIPVGQIKYDLQEKSLDFFTNGISLSNKGMRIDSLGNVGIGIQSLNPSAPLEISAPINNGFIKLSTTNTADTAFLNIDNANLLIGIDPSNIKAGSNIKFQTDDSIKMIISDNGNVGIGTNTPSSKLDVIKSDLTTLSGNSYNTSSNLIIKPSAVSTGNYSSFFSQVTKQGGSEVSSFSSGIFKTFNNGTSYSNTVKGIDIQVNQNGLASSTNLYGLDILARNSSLTDINQVIGLNSQVIVNSSGKINNAYGLKTQINDSGIINVDTGYSLYVGNSAGYYNYGVFQFAESDTNYFAGYTGIGNKSPSQMLDVSGRIKSNGINEVSDKRFKKDITQLYDVLEKVMQLRGVKYKWKKDEFPENKFDDGVQIGVIAQEIEVFFPEVVITDNNGYKSVEYSHLVPVLIEAIKELNNNYQSKLDSIEQENKLLKAIIDDNTSKINQILNLTSLSPTIEK